MKLSKHHIATFIALLFHVSGAIGILIGPYHDWFVKNTALNLLLMVVLLIWNQPQKNIAFFSFFLIAFFTGMGVEMIGVNTARLFGMYRYGPLLGAKINGVPWLIGLNWFVLVFSSGIVMNRLHEWVKLKYEDADMVVPPLIEKLSLIIDGALLATFFDWVMEPVAVKLEFWEWQGGRVPVFNYACWFAVSMLLMLVFSKLRFNRGNHFAVDLLIIQVLFFLALRIYL